MPEILDNLAVAFGALINLAIKNSNYKHACALIKIT